MKVSKKIVSIFVFVIMFIMLSINTNHYIYGKLNKQEPYGVFLNADMKSYKRMIRYKTIVIDGEYFSKKEIRRLHDGGCKNIYSYLNVGSIETFRSYYEKFEDDTLGDYENWPEEKWMDVRVKSWQEQIQKNSKKLEDIGIDGFFVDNTDVYYVYPEKEIYQSIVKMITNLKKYNKTVVINGGDTFVSKYIKENPKKIFDAVNQESVNTEYDFDNHTSKKRKTSERAYSDNYLSKVKKKGYKVYIIEYIKDAQLTKKTKAYSKKKGWILYIAKNIDLS